MRSVVQFKIVWMSLARAFHWIPPRGCNACGLWSLTTARCSKTPSVHWLCKKRGSFGFGVWYGLVECFEEKG